MRLNHRGRKGFAIAYIVSKEWSSARSEKKSEISKRRTEIDLTSVGGIFCDYDKANHHVIRVASMAQFEARCL